MGAKLIFASVVLFPVALLLCFLGDTPAFLFAPATLLFAGVSRMLYAAAFEESTPPPLPGPPLILKRPASNASLATGEIQINATPGSVTERTTHLLDRE